MASVLDSYLIQIPSLDAAVVVNDFFFFEKDKAAPVSTQKCTQ